jgi:cytochrome c heme-lyase
MPATPNQRPAPGQRAPLSTARETSSIPTGGAGSNPDGERWVYPSQQMFYNAMARKGYAPREDEMGVVVAIHNSVNERAWAQLLEWERVLHPECVAGLRLLRFEGKPDEPTPKARARALVGYTPPFDRHDWVVSRCGREVTYLIDFYNGRSTASKPVAMHIDARPAADDAQGAWDRVRMPFMQLWRAATASVPTRAEPSAGGA